MQTRPRPNRSTTSHADFFVTRQNTHALVRLATALSETTAERLRRELSTLKDIIDCVTLEIPTQFADGRSSELMLSDLASFCMTNGMAFGLKVLPRHSI